MGRKTKESTKVVRRDGVEGQLLKAAEVAELLQVRKSTIYKWVHYGYIPHIKLGASLRFDKDSILRWAKNNESKGRKQVFF